MVNENFCEKVRVRFAPSPTGWIHIGSIRQVIFNYLWAKKFNGSFILRIEDTDTKRTVKNGVESIFETFKAFGIEVDEGYEVGGDYGPYIQSKRLDLYKKYAEKLVENGNAYYCFCSSERLQKVREQQQKIKQQPMYDGCCRELDIEETKDRIKAGEKAVIRLKVPRTGFTEYEDIPHGKVKIKNSLIDDQILLKSDGFPTYVFAVVVDDHLMKISHVVRGEEYVSSTPKTTMIYEAFGWKQPFLIQPPNVLNPDGKKKLSKRGGGNCATKFLRQGYLVEALWNFLVLLGWSPSDKDGNPDEIYSIDDLIKLFDLTRVKKAGARFLPDKLDHFNGVYIRQLSITEFTKTIFDWAERYVLHEFVSDGVVGTLDWEKTLINDVSTYLPKWNAESKYFKNVLALVQDRVKYLSEIPDLVRFFYDDELEYNLEDIEGIGSGDLSKALKGAWKGVQQTVANGWDHGKWELAIRSYADELGWKHGDIFMLLRIAITGSRKSPPLFECMELIGVDQCDLFVKDAVKFLDKSM